MSWWGESFQYVSSQGFSQVSRFSSGGEPLSTPTGSVSIPPSIIQRRRRLSADSETLDLVMITDRNQSFLSNPDLQSPVTILNIYDSERSKVHVSDLEYCSPITFYMEYTPVPGLIPECKYPILPHTNILSSNYFLFWDTGTKLYRIGLRMDVQC